MAAKASIYLFFGEDSYSAQQKLKYWKDEFEKKYEEVNITEFDGNNLTSAAFLNAVESVGFLAEKRLIVIHDFLKNGKDKEQQKIAEILEKQKDACVVLFSENERPDQRTVLFKKINKVGVVEEFKFFPLPKIIPWIQQKVTEKGTQISPATATYLANLVGPDLWILSQEIEKLVLYALEREIKKEDIDALVKPNLVTSIFRLTDFLASRNTKNSLETLHILTESGEELQKIFHMIVRHFRILIQVFDLVNRGYQKPEIITKVQEHPFVIMTTMQQCKNFTLDQLKKIYEALLKIEIAFKTGKIRVLADNQKEFELALEKFIIQFCSASAR